MKQYNVQNVKLILTANGVPYEIECRHEDGFEDSPSGETSSETIGSCGQIVVNVLPDASFDITLNLLYGSSENKTMETLYTAWKATKGVFPMQILATDNNTDESYLYTGVAFKQRAATKYANESGTEAKTWEFKAQTKTYIPL